MINLYESEIIDILPDNLKNDMHIQAFCYAFDKQARKILDRSKQLEIWSNLCDVDENLLDYLAAELRTQYYSSDLDIDVKRKLIANTLIWYQKAGTVAAVQELVETLFEEGKIVEWYNYEGCPHHFKVKAVNPLINDSTLKEFYNIIKQVKRKTAILDSFELFYNALINVDISIESRMFIKSDFYHNLRLLPILEMSTEADVESKVEAMLTVEKNLWCLDGTYHLDGEKILNAIKIKETL